MENVRPGCHGSVTARERATGQADDHDPPATPDRREAKGRRIAICRDRIAAGRSLDDSPRTVTAGRRMRRKPDMTRSRQDAIEITVNGRPHRVEATPETPLLYVLRNELRLNAARFGCGLGRCGACTVLVDGEAVLSCVASVGDAAGRQVTTLEGLGGPDALHPLQRAFLDEQAAQCGYCIPGIVMTAAAFLRRNPRPTEAEIVEALNGTLCRCGAHVRILRAVQRAAEAAA
jgi:nicotinate dehydrogenase subunit A